MKVALRDVQNVNVELLPYYMQALKNAKYITLEEVQEIIIQVNEIIQADAPKGQFILERVLLYKNLF